MGRALRSGGLLVVALAILAGCSGRSEPDAPAPLPERPSAAQLMDRFVAVWNRDDLEGVSEIFGPDAVVLIDGEEHQGGDAIDRNFIRYNFPIATDLRVRPIASGSSGELAFYTGRFTQRIAVPRERAYTQTGRHTFVWELADGAWELKSVLMVTDDPEP